MRHIGESGNDCCYWRHPECATLSNLGGEKLTLCLEWFSLSQHFITAELNTSMSPVMMAVHWLLFSNESACVWSFAVLCSLSYYADCFFRSVWGTLHNKIPPSFHLYKSLYTYSICKIREHVLICSPNSRLKCLLSLIKRYYTRGPRWHKKTSSTFRKKKTSQCQLESQVIQSIAPRVDCLPKRLRGIHRWSGAEGGDDNRLQVYLPVYPTMFNIFAQQLLIVLTLPASFCTFQ